MYIFCAKVLDELLPKATGREAKFEKKRARIEARREKECSPGEYNYILSISYIIARLLISKACNSLYFIFMQNS